MPSVCVCGRDKAGRMTCGVEPIVNTDSKDRFYLRIGEITPKINTGGKGKPVVDGKIIHNVIPERSMEVTEKENASKGALREEQENCVASRQPLHDVINSAIPVPSTRCRIPLPQKYGVSKLPGPRPSVNTKFSRLSTGLNKLSYKSQSAFRPVSNPGNLPKPDAEVKKVSPPVPRGKETLAPKHDYVENNPSQEFKIQKAPEVTEDLVDKRDLKQAAFQVSNETESFEVKQIKECSVKQTVLQVCAETESAGIDLEVKQVHVSQQECALKETLICQPVVKDTFVSAPEEKLSSPGESQTKETCIPVCVFETETPVPVSVVEVIDSSVADPEINDASPQDINDTSLQDSVRTDTLLDVPATKIDNTICSNLSINQASLEKHTPVPMSETFLPAAEADNSHCSELNSNPVTLPRFEDESCEKTEAFLTELKAESVDSNLDNNKASAQMQIQKNTSASIPKTENISLSKGHRKSVFPDQHSPMSPCTCIQQLTHEGKVLMDATEYDTLKNDVKITRKSILLLERLNTRSSEELFEATCQVGGLAAEIDRLRKENGELSSELEGLHLILSKQLNDEAEREMTAASLRLMEEKLQQETLRCQQLKEQEKELKSTQVCLFSELETRLLQQEEKIQQQQKSLHYRNNEIEEQTNTIERLSSQLEQIEGVKDSMEFLEAEYKALVEEHNLLKESNGTAVQRLQTCERELANKEKQCNQFEAELIELRKEHSTTKTELMEVYSVAKERMANQNGEIQRYSQLVGQFSHDLTGQLKSLLLTAGMKVSPNLVKDFGQKSNHSWMKSVVSSVLEAVGDNPLNTKELSPKDRGDKSAAEANICADPCEHVDSSSVSGNKTETTILLTTYAKSPVTSELAHSTDLKTQRSPKEHTLGSPVTTSRLNLGSSFSSSAFDPVKLKEGGKVFSGSVNLSESSRSQRVHELLGISQSNGDREGELTARTEHLSLVLAETVRINRILEEAAFLSIRDLRKDNDSLKDELENIETELEEKDKEVERVRHELSTEKVLTRQLTSEKTILLAHQKELLQKLEENVAQSAPVNSVAAVESRFYTEKLHLQKNVYILQEQLNQKEEEIEQINEKAVRRMTVWRENCVKADREVNGLDKIVENVRQVLYKNRSVFNDCEPIKRLLKELNGKVQNNDDSILKPLEPVKTTFW